jgi:sortase A
MDRNLWRDVERLLLAVGIILLALYSVVRLDAWISSRLALRTFDQAVSPGPGAPEQVDFALWSPSRVRQYKASLAGENSPPWGVLGIAKLRLRVPIFDGTDDVTLNRGAGWIAGTGRPGDEGNVGIAGHRDGFFRGLKDIVEGDAITLMTANEESTYLVDQIHIVTPDRVDVLQPRASPSLTLVTCYPFYFVGDAPQRFIVHATLARTVARGTFERASR